MTRIVAACGAALALSGCVIDAGVELRFAVESEAWTTLEVTVLRGPCAEELLERDGSPSRLGAIRLLEGTLPEEGVVARYVLDATGVRDSETIGRLPRGTYCVGATARGAACAATALSLSTLSLDGQFGDAAVVRVLPVLTYDPPVGAGTCGRRLCIDETCVAIEEADPRCATSPAPAACELCDAIRTPTSITSSTGGRGVCSLTFDLDPETRLPGPLYARADNVTLRASSISASYEAATLQVCVTGCLITGLQSTIEDRLTACAESEECRDAVLRAAGEGCGGCCAGLQEAGPCGTALGAYVACATPSAVNRAFSTPRSCESLARSFLTDMQCGEGSGCESCLAALEGTYGALGTGPMLVAPDEVTDLLVGTLCSTPAPAPAPKG